MKFFLYPKELYLKPTFFVGYYLITDGLYFMVLPHFLSFISTYMRDPEELIEFSKMFLRGSVFFIWLIACITFWLDLNIKAKFLTPETRANHRRRVPFELAILILPSVYLAAQMGSYSSWGSFLSGTWSFQLLIVVLAFGLTFAAKKRMTHLNRINRAKN